MPHALSSDFMNSLPFVLGELYAHDYIIKELKIGNSGGIRIAMANRTSVDRVVLFSTSEQEANPTENPYEDRAKGAILTYTGSGKIGHQHLSGQNVRITQQELDFFPIYVFSLFRHRKAPGSPDRRWRFSGIYKYLVHTRENQTDLLGSDRNAWIFKLLRLDIHSAHPDLEVSIRKYIAGAFADPLLSAHALLGESAGYSAKEIEIVIGKLKNLNPFAFEDFVKQVLVASEFREVHVTRHSSDGGIDVVARMPLMVWPVESNIIQVQAKRWSHPVGRREVAELRGSLLPKAIGVLVTTGNYARTAIKEADRPNLFPISLVDGHKLASTVIRLKMAVG
ncbi:MAG: restriction endonuclease [Kiritimatiellia bacterium]